MNKTLLKRYGAYLLRWQLSTPILALCMLLFVEYGTIWSTIIANLVGGLMFFWVDKFIFQSKKMEYKGPIWDVIQHSFCSKCNKKGRTYRLVKYDRIGYDRSDDKKPQFLCEKCSNEKYDTLLPFKYRLKNN